MVIADNFSNAKPEVIDNIQNIAGKPVGFYMIDLCDLEGIRRIFMEHSIDVVIHFAGIKVSESVRKPLEYYETTWAKPFSKYSITVWRR